MIDPIKVARDLSEIIDLASDLLAQAVNDARAHVDGTSLPGGRAMVALAPVAKMDTYLRKARAVELAWLADRDAGIRRERPDFDDEDETAEPALQTLRFWSDHYRRIHQQDWDMIRTIGTEANYLKANLDWILGREPNVDMFARDINQARVRLEGVLHAGKRPDRTRIVCNNPMCEDPRQLIKLWSRGEEDQDRWKCSSCKSRYDVDQLKRAHADQLRHETAARFVKQAEAISTLKAQGRSEHTIRRWLECPIRPTDRCTRCRKHWPAGEYPVCPRKITKTGEACGGELARLWKGDRDDVVEGYCDLATHTVWVWWPDLWTRHLTRATRQRRTA